MSSNSSNPKIDFIVADLDLSAVCGVAELWPPSGGEKGRWQPVGESEGLWGKRGVISGQTKRRDKIVERVSDGNEVKLVLERLSWVLWQFDGGVGRNNVNEESSGDADVFSQGRRRLNQTWIRIDLCSSNQLMRAQE
ncbi:hypothetical protein L1887_29915 [Cichorium endivia]|nr:hypothetical protein L1887_29915 [Cichorium endivia]